MTKNSKKTQFDSIIESFKEFIPETIIMKASAYRDPKSRENTCLNVYDRAKREFLEQNRNYMSFDFSDIHYHILEIIDKRTLVTVG